MTYRRQIVAVSLGMLALLAVVLGVTVLPTPTDPDGSPAVPPMPPWGGATTPVAKVPASAAAQGVPAQRPLTRAPSPLAVMKAVAPAVLREGRYSVDVAAEASRADEQHGVLCLGPEAAARGGTWRAARLQDAGGTSVVGAIRVASDGTFDACVTRPQDDGTLGLRLCAATSGLALGRAPGAEAREWHTDEGAVHGWSRVHYVRQGDVITKVWTGDPGVPNLELHGRSVIALGPAGVVSVELTESGHMGEAPAVFTVSTRSVARYVDADHGLDLAALDLAALAPPSVGPSEPRPDPAARPFEEVLADLGPKAHSDKPSRRAEERDELTYAIRASVVAAEAAGDLLASGERDPAERSVLVAALVGAETAASQAAVLDLLVNRARSSELRVDLLNAVTLMQHPTTGMAESLIRMATSGDPLAHGAAVAAGGVSSRLDDEAREATVTALIAAAEPILTPQGTGADPFLPNQRAGTRAAWVDALGNTADPRILPLVSQSLNEPSTIVRAAAADALRFLHSPSCARIMEEAMLTEHSVHVRGRLVTSAGKMGPERMGSFVERALFKDDSGYVRRTAAFVAAMWATTAPGYLEVLARALKEEKEPDVAEAISNHLHPNDVHGDENMRLEMLPEGDDSGAPAEEKAP